MKTCAAESSAGVRSGVLAAAFLASFVAWADPISLPEKPITPEITFLLGSAILLEVACVWAILRRWGKPRFFVLWLIGMHAVTYPGLLALLAALDELRPVSAALIGETVVVAVEGAIIYTLCRFFQQRKSGLSAPSALRCWLASLVGNICSVAAFPVLSAAFERFGPR
jgi:hypothetical protein